MIYDYVIDTLLSTLLVLGGISGTFAVLAAIGHFINQKGNDDEM